MLKNYIHLSICTTLSMIISFILYFTFGQSRAENSLVQHFPIDVIRDHFLTLRCWLQDRYSLSICCRLYIDFNDKKVQLFGIITILVAIMLLCYGLEFLNRIRPITLTIQIVWLLARLCEDKIFWYKIDFLTVYFISWQCAYLICKWEEHDLFPPFLLIQQGSLCLSISLTSFLYYDIILRYIPIHINIVLFWLWSLYDIYSCLYVGGWIRTMFDNTTSEFSPSGYYYPYDINDDNFDNEYYLSLGLGDFLVFNLMILSIQSSFWMITTKIYVLLGSIIVIQCGHSCMRIVQRIWIERSMPMLPFAVIPFTAYVIILHHILFYQINQCTDE